MLEYLPPAGKSLPQFPNTYTPPAPHQSGIIDPSTGSPFIGEGSNPAFVLPTEETFQTKWQSPWRTYLQRYDEALRFDRKWAKSMYLDAFTLSLLNERILGTTSLNWHIEVEDEDDPAQKAIKDGLEAIIKSTPHLSGLLKYLMEAVWYGRHGAQLGYVPKSMMLPSLTNPREKVPTKTYVVEQHKPENGDKIIYCWDGTPGIRVRSQVTGGRIPGAEFSKAEDSWILLLKGSWRSKFIIHQHEVQDADFFEGDQAGSIHGVGIRSFIHWTEWLRKEWIGNIADWSERTGLGTKIWYYQLGNPESYKATKAAAEMQSDKTNILVARNPQNGQEGVEFVQDRGSAVNLLLTMIEHLEDHMERYIIGQSMSGGSEKAGIGSEGVASLAGQTKSKLISFDANNLADTLTSDWVMPLVHWTYPDYRGPTPRWKFVVDQQDRSQQMAAINAAVALGAAVKESEVQEIAGITPPKDTDRTLSIINLQKQQNTVAEEQQDRMAQKQMQMQQQPGAQPGAQPEQQSEQQPGGEQEASQGDKEADLAGLMADLGGSKEGDNKSSPGANNSEPAGGELRQTAADSSGQQSPEDEETSDDSEHPSESDIQALLKELEEPERHAKKGQAFRYEEPIGEKPHPAPSGLSEPAKISPQKTIPSGAAQSLRSQPKPAKPIAPVAPKLDSMGLYSNIHLATQQMPQDRMPTQDFRAHLAKTGGTGYIKKPQDPSKYPVKHTDLGNVLHVPGHESDVVGLEKFLQGKPQVTRDEILKHIEDSEPKFGEHSQANVPQKWFARHPENRGREGLGLDQYFDDEDSANEYVTNRADDAMHRWNEHYGGSAIEETEGEDGDQAWKVGDEQYDNIEAAEQAMEELNNREADEAYREHRGEWNVAEEDDPDHGGMQVEDWSLPGSKSDYDEVHITAPSLSAELEPKPLLTGVTAKIEDVTDGMDKGKRIATILDSKGQQLFAYVLAKGGEQYHKNPEQIAQDYESVKNKGIEYENAKLAGESRKWKDGHGFFEHIDNPVVRARHNMRQDDDGKRMFFLEELQLPKEDEKMPQWLRDKGYDIGLKAMISKAVKSGAERFGWTTGKQQADRYSLATKVHSLEWSPTASDKAPGGKTIYLSLKNNWANDFGMLVDKEGIIVDGPEEAKGKPLSEVIGKEAASKVIGEESGDMPGGDLEIGGEGLKDLYDKMIPGKIQGLLKKHGIRAGKGEVETKGKSHQPRYELNQGGSGWLILDKVDGKTVAEFTEHHQAMDWERRQPQRTIPVPATKEPIWEIELTPEVKAWAMGGIARYERADQ